MRSPESQERFCRESSQMRQRFRSGRRYIEDVHWAWVSEISDRVIDELNAGHLVKLSPTRSESFSSIDSVNTRKKFKLAVENIKRGILCIASTSGKGIKFVTIMDSPPDLSPNAPPSGFDDTNNYFANLQAPPAPPSSASTGQASTEGSVDSSGFEKVDHDVLEEYGQQFVNQMQQALFGNLPEEMDAAKQDMSSQSPHDDVLEKSYGDLIDIPRNEPVHPEPPKYEDEHKHEHHEHEHHGDHESTGSKSNTLNSFDLLGDEVHDPKPVVSAPQPQSPQSFDTFHHIHDDAPFEPVGRGGVPLDQLIEDQVAEVHGDVDEVLHRMQETDEYRPEHEHKEEHHHKEEHPHRDEHEHEQKDERYRHHYGEDSDSDEPDFRSQTPEADESTFNRRGPLTIPEVPETLPTHPAHDDIAEHAEHEQPDLSPIHDFRSGFDIHPRPPTPPKDINEELVKPSAFSLPHTHTTPSHSQHEGLHSILKHGGSYSAEPWFDFKSVDPHILELLYWRDPKKSAVALSLILLAVFILGKYPILSVLAYTGLAILAGTVGFRVFKTVEAQVKKTSGENPFQEYLAKDLQLPQERIHAQVDVLAEHGTALFNQLKRLIFVENIVDSVKFALILWALTYIGYWFSGFAIVILAVLGAFSIPKIYEMYQEPIDQQLAMISEHISKATKMAEDKLPFLKKAEVQEKKEQ